jgi:predicted RNA-binding protein
MERMEGIVSGIAERLLTSMHLFAQNPMMELETFFVRPLSRWKRR